MTRGGDGIGYTVGTDDEGWGKLPNYNIDNRETRSGKGVRDWIHCGYTLWPKHCSASQLDREKVEN